jgi:heparan-alpha-glucosaminide N-acetyltransferase
MPGMNPRETAPANANVPSIGFTARIMSIDVFRGLTVLVMVFVDNLDFVKGLPWWTYHMPRQVNGMTYVDMVFPAFLFVMGMSLPPAVARRSAAGDSPGKIWLHLLGRSLSLVALGLFIANGPQVDQQRAGISPVVWDLLGFAGIALFWGSRNASAAAAANKPLRRVMKYAGLSLLIVLAIVFRRATRDGHTAWFDFSDWEILGLLGWAYLLTGSVYLLFQKNLAALVASLAALSALNALSTLGWFDWLKRFPPYVQPFEAGLSSITLAGLIASLILVGGVLGNSFRTKAFWAVIYAAILAGAAWALTPLGVSKLRDTPPWCLYCAAANTLLMVLLYSVSDIKNWARWAAFVKPAGSNALLAYLLAYVAYFIPVIFRLTADGTAGWYGVMRSLLFAALVLAGTAVLTHFRFRLQI